MAPMLARLEQLKKLIDDDIATYIGDLDTDTAAGYGRFSNVAINSYSSILNRGGKRLRGALAIVAYQMLGGKDDQLILRAARALEMMHAYVLIIDDVCDRSVLRRGGQTAHEIIKIYHKQNNLNGNSEHFGDSVATLAAMAGCHLAIQEFCRLPVADSAKLLALDNLNDTLVTTVHGQFNDLFHQTVNESVSEEEVKRVLTWKTAYYSFMNPLQTGAVLARADSRDIAALEAYSLHAGLSYQIIDDIIGMFGSAEVSGKSPLDDLKEGKITLLIARAMHRANSEQKRALLAALGNQQLTSGQKEQCMQVIQDTGSLDYSRQLAGRFARKAVETLGDAPSRWDRDGIDFLKGLAEYITKRSV